MAIPFHPVPSVPDEDAICIVCREPSDELICSGTCQDVLDIKNGFNVQYDIDPEDALYA